MVDKIVQLIDKDGDNIYPIASVPHGASITMTNTDPGEGTPLEEDSYIGVYGGDPIIMDYSTNEVNTGAKWIDGSKIYRKTINLGSMPNNGNQSYAHNISNFSELIEIVIRWYDTDDKKWYNSPRFDSGSTLICLAGVNGTNIIIKGVGTNWSTRTNNGYATMWYTKSS